MASDLPQEKQEAGEDDHIDWNNRVLCSDGNCIGVVGPDGRCKECGKTYEGELPESVTSEAADEPDMADAEVDEEQSSTAADTDANADRPADDDWENRVLCSDGNCIGIIGPDGKCKECGKALK
jgi:hypothetical protein